MLSFLIFLIKNKNYFVSGICSHYDIQRFKKKNQHLGFGTTGLGCYTQLQHSAYCKNTFLPKWDYLNHQAQKATAWMKSEECLESRHVFACQACEVTSEKVFLLFHWRCKHIWIFWMPQWQLLDVYQTFHAVHASRHQCSAGDTILLAGPQKRKM